MQLVRQPLPGGLIDVTIPSGLTIAQTGTSSHVTNVATNGNSRQFAFADLPPGATGAISMDLRIPSPITPNGTTWSWTSQMSGSNTPTVTSPQVSITAEAAATTSAQSTMVSGGAVGSVTSYLVKGCNARRLPESRWGPLGVVAGSTLSVTIPDSASIVDAAGAR